MPADSFVHLHLHAEYSTLDGAKRIPDGLRWRRNCARSAWSGRRRLVPVVRDLKERRFLTADPHARSANLAESRPHRLAQCPTKRFPACGLTTFFEADSIAAVSAFHPGRCRAICLVLFRFKLSPAQLMISSHLLRRLAFAGLALTAAPLLAADFTSTWTGASAN